MLRDYQILAFNRCKDIINKYDMAYLAGEVRTGKTLVALTVGEYFVNRSIRKRPYVLFITTKKAISSIRKDYKTGKFTYELDVINYEQAHKHVGTPAFIILDEAHKLGGFPKPPKTAKILRDKFANIKALFLSGTPTPESNSQLFHQFWITGERGPWGGYTNFYKWAKDFVIPKKMFIGFGKFVVNYKDTIPDVIKTFKKYRVTMTQKEARFNGKIIEKIHHVPTPSVIMNEMKQIRKHSLSTMLNAIAYTAAKRTQLYHQLSSGTFIDDNGESWIISSFKVSYIKKHFVGRKIVIFYLYVAEGDLLKESFPNWTDDPDVFNKSKDRPFICQIVSGREGINLSTADDIINFNVPWSAVSYQQGIARSQSKDGGDKLVHWLFSKTGFEQEVYNTVINKKNFTSQHFNENKFFNQEAFKESTNSQGAVKEWH